MLGKLVHTLRVDDFQALISSLGENTVVYVGKENLATLVVFGDEADMTAEIEIGLNEDSWDKQSAAIDKMLEIREMFIDEIAISYRFVSPDSETAGANAARHPDFCLV